MLSCNDGKFVPLSEKGQELGIFNIYFHSIKIADSACLSTQSFMFKHVHVYLCNMYIFMLVFEYI